MSCYAGAGARVSVIIPALNEQESIARVINDIPRGCVSEIIVVDNGSADLTAYAAAQAGARVVKESEKGYGAACLKGISAASDPDIIAFMDGDYSDYPEDIEAVLAPVAAGRADFAVGSRIAGSNGRQVLPPHSYWGNVLSVWLISILYGFRFTDLGPMRAIRYEALRRLHMQDRNFGWTAEMQVKAIINNLSVEEVPVRYRARIGTSKVTGTMTGSLCAGCKIIYTIMSCRVSMAGRKHHKKKNT